MEKMPKFWIETTPGGEEQEEFFVGKKSVGCFNHDTHGWQGMRDAEKLFENTAKTLGAAFERR
jgi:hypothetical protein